MTVNLHIGRLVLEELTGEALRESSIEDGIRLELTKRLQAQPHLPEHFRSSSSRPSATATTAHDGDLATQIGCGIHEGFGT